MGVTVSVHPMRKARPPPADMPKLTFKTQVHRIAREPPQEVSELALKGFIDAANYMTFEKALERADSDSPQFLVIDFALVNYINSTGISVLIRFSETYKSRGGLLCLAGVSRSVGLSMHLLGVTSLIPFTRDVQAGRDYVVGFLDGEKPAQPVVAEGNEPEGVRHITAEFRDVPKGGGEGAHVLVLSPSTTRFTEVMERRFNSLRGQYHMLSEAGEALRRFDEIAPDLVVLDERCDPSGDFVNKVKAQKKKSLTSVIKIYPDQAAVGKEREFKIWENDYLVDPFEVQEFFALTEAELARVPKDRKVFSQQVRFDFRSNKKCVENAYRLSDLIIRQAMEEEDEITSLYAAVKEGIDNAVAHGNRRDEELRVEVNFLVDNTKVTVLVEDQGEGFEYDYYLSKLNREDAFEEAKKRIVEEGTRGGLGILLMSRCTDRIHYAGFGNILRLEKNITARRQGR